MVDEQALVDSLKERTTTGAALDVYEFEPENIQDYWKWIMLFWYPILEHGVMMPVSKWLWNH